MWKNVFKTLKNGLINNKWINVAIIAIVLYDIGVLFLHNS